MSTAGKVLTVLILMVVPIWILLVAAVADLNTNGTQAVKRLQEQVARLETQVVANEKKILDLQDQIAFEQAAMDRDRTVIRTQLAEVERARSAMIEIKRDVQLQLETIAAALKDAEVARDHRIAEKTAEIQAKADAEKSVDKLQGENSELMTQLQRLRGEFKATLEDNRKMVDRLLQQSASRPG
jgi:chromosome segregation ATPase